MGVFTLDKTAQEELNDLFRNEDHWSSEGTPGEGHSSLVRYVSNLIIAALMASGKVEIPAPLGTEEVLETEVIELAAVLRRRADPDTPMS
ncbi:hypothetical protein A3B18_03795 [Candidatus Giovannonibacteria bacterium RIFCSPLOWO2_01_FULL_46_13]|uniref:Uncharacterized protein n=1 Tax=Candidatus Giovannonibacteria bacterium RIFCSPLOWO2_01_FULL_46_13 TaxID=1798352 RepID=A0A1F5X3H6_9BACT|nr:MAG: hypothetical protein A3B18_03795 [Candidatus Giovannonibacteria bacterium RIFCSPLOWO2_01_FULL_46_13]